MDDVITGIICGYADMILPWQKNYGDIWEKLYKIPFENGKKPNIIFNLLHQMGIYANAEVTKDEHIQWFLSITEAVQDQGAGLNLQTQKQYDILMDYLLNQKEKERNM